MRFAFTALLLFVAATARASDDIPSVLVNPPAPAAQVLCSDAVVVAETETCCRSRVRRGLAPRVVRGTVEVSRTVVRTVTRPVGRLCGVFGCR